MDPMTNDQLDEAIANWHVLNKVLNTFTEEDCENAISRELVGNRRKDITLRLHQRYTMLRRERERDELIATLADVPMFLQGVKK